MLRIADFPQLKLIAWSRDRDGFIEDDDALRLYERNWEYVDQSALSPEERQLIDRLSREFGNGVLNV